MTDARLVMDFHKQLAAFPLRVQLTVGTEILVLFGPSGAGKSMTLQAIAGLLIPDSGFITLDGQVFFRHQRPGVLLHVAARKRRIGYVFQQAALFPHLTAVQNVAYPLWPQRHRRQRALALLERMHLAHLAERYPHTLSGGQQQRVALARALAVEPRILLLDEPFSGLDTAVREHLQRDLRRLQEEFGLVVLYVTHNLEEAFQLGHRLALIREGRVEQVGPIAEVFRHPVNSHAATILGVRNLFRAHVVEATSEGLRLAWDGLFLDAPPHPAHIGETLTAYIRPEDIKVLYPDRPLSHAVRYNQVTGTVNDRHTSASFQTLSVTLSNGHDVEVRFPGSAYMSLPLLPGQRLHLSLRKEALVILPALPDCDVSSLRHQ